jgi:hypothetical protein
VFYLFDFVGVLSQMHRFGRTELGIGVTVNNDLGNLCKESSVVQGFLSHLTDRD